VSSSVIKEYQASFYPRGSATDQIFTVSQILEKYLEFENGQYQLFIDFKHLIWIMDLRDILLYHGIP
jgi:hypothetical protein